MSVATIASVARHTEASLSVRSVPALRQISKDNGWKGYSTMTKAQLIVYILSNGQRASVPSKDAVKPVKGPSVASLKVECKSRGNRGYSKLTRAELVTALETGTAPKHVAKVGSVDWLRQLATEHGIKGRSKMDKAALINALADTDAVVHLIESGLEDYTPPVRIRKSA